MGECRTKVVAGDSKAVGAKGYCDAVGGEKNEPLRTEKRFSRGNGCHRLRLGSGGALCPFHQLFVGNSQRLLLYLP